MSLLELDQSAWRLVISCGTGPFVPPSPPILSRPCDHVQLPSRYSPWLKCFSTLNCMEEKNELPELSSHVMAETPGRMEIYGRRGSIAPGPGCGRLMFGAHVRCAPAEPT